MECVAVNLRGFAATQLLGFEFNSMVNFNGMKIGANSSGLYEIDEGELDADGHIDAYFILHTTDFGLQQNKGLRFAYIGLESTGYLVLTLTSDGGVERRYLVNPPRKRGQYRVRVHIGRDQYGRYWSFKIENKDGCDFSIDSIKILPVVHSSGLS